MARDKEEGKVRTGKIEARAALSPAEGGNVLIGATLATAILSLSISLSFLTPLLLSIPVLPFLNRALRQWRPKAALRIVLRWSLSVFIFVTILAGYFPVRMAHAVPWSSGMTRAISGWLAGGSAPLGIPEMLAWAAAIAATAYASGGLLGAVVLSCLLSIIAAEFMYVLRHGDNLFHIIAIGIPPWILFLAAFGILIVVPVSLPFYSRIYGIKNGHGKEKRASLTYGRLALLLLLLALVLHPTLGSLWRRLLAGCTVLR